MWKQTALFLLSWVSCLGRQLELNTTLMNSTFLIRGPKRGGKPDEMAFATAFLIGSQIPGNTSRAYVVLVTAAHLFEDMAGEQAILTLRFKQPSGSYTIRDQPIRIRRGVQNLYARHPDADVAALYIAVPTDATISLLTTSFFADEDTFKKYELHPGDEMLCLGYPLGVTGPFGFPILRSGKIGSFPLVPFKETKGFYLDFRVFFGNSGGPVYFIDRSRVYGNTLHIGESIQFIAGLVSAQIGSRVYRDEPISLAQVIPAPFIIETINLLPPESPNK